MNSSLPIATDRADRRSGHGRAVGFTLVEMLVVIAIISLLLTVAGPIMNSILSKESPATVAAAVSGQLERARSHAMAKSTYVWVRLGKVAEEPHGFYIGTYESPDGTNNPLRARGAWTAPRFSNFKLSNQLEPAFVRPSVPVSDRVDTAAWIRFSPNGEAWTLPADPTQSRVKMLPPAAEGKIARWTEIGLQPTRGGQVVPSVKQDVAAVHLSGLTGQTLRFSR